MSRTRRRAILHIGTAKTGTTSLQVSLRSQRPALLARGVCYPTAPGIENHTRLAIHAGLGSARVAELLGFDPDFAGDADGFARRFPEALAEELEALDDDVHTVIFSNEHCHSRLRTVAEVERIRDLIAPFFDTIRIVVYLRRQDQLAVSRFTTALRTGVVAPALLPPEDPDGAAFFDHEALLARWSAVFGREAMLPRIHDRRDLLQGSVVPDFLAVCGIEDLFPKPAYDALNPSLRPAAQAFLARFNLHYCGLGATRRPAHLYQILIRGFAGQGLLPTRGQAEAFLARFEPGNQRVCASYFPGRAQLFDLDLSQHPAAPEVVPEAEIRHVAAVVVDRFTALRAEGRLAAREEHLALEAAAAVLDGMAPTGALGPGAAAPD